MKALGMNEHYNEITICRRSYTIPPCPLRAPTDLTCHKEQDQLPRFSLPHAFHHLISRTHD